MKELFLVRHAKSSWPSATESDFDRPLNGRGKKDAPIMGKHLKISREVVLGQVICSPAKRARATAKRLLEGLDYPFEQVVWKEVIYSGNDTDLLKLVQGTDDGHPSLMVIGHNPYITDLVCLLANESIDDMPTCGVFAVTFDVTTWSSVSSGLGKKRFFDVPKLI
ncbi:MAG: histidine phosphatase family protein [Candidatus Latescibacteria bacterium]|nr:histidine phosphatase family protein [Candidatus Latescibacterota bacterium]